MNETNPKTVDSIDISRIAYIRALKTRELAEIPNEALENVADPDRLVVLSSGDGEKLAIIEGREAAIAAAYANALVPVSVH